MAQSPAETFACRIVQRLQSAGHTAYFAGGCVRDQLMGRPPKDYDVATSATPDQVLALFPRGQQVGAAFGVILLVEKSQGQRLQVEVATFRTDGTYSDGRHPDAVHFTTAQIDAQRRDFTCNGLFFDPLANNGAGQLHDFVGGQADIHHKILRAIGDPEARFQEDHLRMLRAVRFAARLGFTLEPATRQAILRGAAHIKAISRERIGEELRLILEHPTRAAAAALLEDLTLIRQLWPFLIPASPRHSLASSALARIAHLPDQVRRPLAIAALTLDYASPGTSTEKADALQRAFILANDERDEIAWLLEKRPLLLERTRWTRPNLKKLLADPRWPDLLALYFAERAGKGDADLDARIAQMQDEGVAPAPFITGETLIQLGASPGPNFKRWLDALYDRQLELEFTIQEQALAAAQQLIAAPPP